MKSATPSTSALRREIGVFGAAMMGLGSIVGTGVFVSIGIAAGAAGPAVVLAIALAALVATCNGLSSAELAANHPTSGGTYEYGYRWLSPSLGFTAGWMFLCAKSASAATAALGFSGYVLQSLNADRAWLSPLAVATVAVLMFIVLAGMRRSNMANILIVAVTLLALAAFVAAGLPTALAAGSKNLTPLFAPTVAGNTPAAGFFEATALMFVAYTGYGRIATLGEEIRDPRRNIPLAIIFTLVASMAIYIAVGLVGLAAVGADAFSRATSEQAAPLEVVARSFGVPGASTLVAIGAMTAMLGVLLNLLLGLSRVLLAMGRRRDMPALVARIDRASTTPYVAVIAIGLAIAGLAAIGSVKTTWSFSAFTVLIYYALTNLAALRLGDNERLYPRWIAGLGLAACLFLAFWVEWRIWFAGVGLLAVGLVWHLIFRWLTRRAPDSAK